jgi:hypothetical protein
MISLAAFDGTCGAVISRNGLYRYALWRSWEWNRERVMFIGLNPSTADAQQDDPTIRRCIGFAKNWGYGGLLVGNLFAYRTARPETLRCSQNPIGRLNDVWLNRMADEASFILACWGNQGAFKNRDREIVRKFDKLKCLKLNQSGAPAHPLYLAKSLAPMKFVLKVDDARK